MCGAWQELNTQSYFFVSSISDTPREQTRVYLTHLGVPRAWRGEDVQRIIAAQRLSPSWPCLALSIRVSPSSSPLYPLGDQPFPFPLPLAAHTHPGPEAIAPDPPPFLPASLSPRCSPCLPLLRSLSPAESLLCTVHCVYKKTMTVFYFSLLSPILP